MLRLLPLLLSAVLFVGCTTPQKAYIGDIKSAPDLSVISPPPAKLFKLGPVVNIRAVDGFKLEKLKSGAYQVLPGEHTVRVVLFSASRMGVSMTHPAQLSFKTEAGKKYIIDYEWPGERVMYFVTEESTGNRVPWH